MATSRRRPAGFGQNTVVDVRVTVGSGPLAPPGDWVSAAPHLVRAVLDDRARMPGIPRHKGIVAIVRAIDDAPAPLRRGLWRTIRRGFGLYDPEVLREEALGVGLLAAVPEQAVLGQPELEDATQLALFAAVPDERPTS